VRVPLARPRCGATIIAFVTACGTTTLIVVNGETCAPADRIPVRSADLDAVAGV
jgi:hypothetical protein